MSYIYEGPASPRTQFARGKRRELGTGKKEATGRIEAVNDTTLMKDTWIG